MTAREAPSHSPIDTGLEKAHLANRNRVTADHFGGGVKTAHALAANNFCQPRYMAGSQCPKDVVQEVETLGFVGPAEPPKVIQQTPTTLKNR